MNIWNECAGLKNVSPLQETVWRMVETQQIFSIRKLVDTSKEQMILEELLELTKPYIFEKEFVGLHRLLYTPFCDPSLHHGSRFGNVTERSLWYGSRQLMTVLAEKAYYQFLFLHASFTEFDNVLRSFTAFSTQVKTDFCIDLSKPPFSQYLDVIVSTHQYTASQALGYAMRNDHIAAISYPSARDPNKGTNIAIFNPSAFSHKKPQSGSFQTWYSLTSNSTMEFTRVDALNQEYKIFHSDEVMKDVRL